MTAPAPAETPAALVSEPLDNDDEPEPKPLGAPSMDTRPSTESIDPAMAGGQEETASDLRMAGMPGSSIAASVGPAGFKLLIILIASVIVMIESCILVDKLKRAETEVTISAPVEAVESNVTISNTDSDERASLELACRSAGTLSELVVELLEAGLSATPDNANYGVAVSTVSLIFTLLFVALAKYKPGTLSSFALPLPRNQGTLSAQQVFFGFLLLWWGPGACVLTFHGPYRTTSNPYFACWAALFASTMLCADAFTKMKVGLQTIRGASESGSHLREMAGLFVASVTLFFASVDFGDHSTGKYGISLGVISTAASLATPYLIDTKKIGPPARKIIAASLFVLWVAAVTVLTFDSPFTATGNGYFACWGGTVCATLFAYREFFEMQVQWIDGRFQSFSCRPQEMPGAAEGTAA